MGTMLARGKIALLCFCRYLSLILPYFFDIMIKRSKIMAYNGEGVAALVSIIDELQTVNLILADKKVKELLKCLAFYPEFRAVLAKVNQGFDYQNEKKKALQRVGEHQVLRLPKGEKQLVAFVSNMLVEMDAGAMDLLAFSRNYFPATTGAESLDLFVTSVIEPFKYAIVDMVVNGIKEEQVLVERSIDFAPSGMGEQVKNILVAIVKGVNECQAPASTRAELLLMLEGFAAALDNRDVLMIKAIWIGLKKYLATAKICAKEIEQTETVLSMYLSTK